MTARKGSGTSVLVTYTPACGATDHVIYWGTTPIAGSVNWTNAACGRGTTGAASFDPGTPPSARAFYFVIVGQNATKEGSYGTGSRTVRPEAVGIGTCDRPLDLTGALPLMRRGGLGKTGLPRPRGNRYFIPPIEGAGAPTSRGSDFPLARHLHVEDREWAECADNDEIPPDPAEGVTHRIHRARGPLARSLRRGAAPPTGRAQTFEAAAQ